MSVRDDMNLPSPVRRSFPEATATPRIAMRDKQTLAGHFMRLVPVRAGMHEVQAEWARRTRCPPRGQSGRDRRRPGRPPIRPSLEDRPSFALRLHPRARHMMDVDIVFDEVTSAEPRQGDSFETAGKRGVLREAADPALVGDDRPRLHAKTVPDGIGDRAHRSIAIQAPTPPPAVSCLNLPRRLRHVRMRKPRREAPCPQPPPLRVPHVDQERLHCCGALLHQWHPRESCPGSRRRYVRAAKAAAEQVGNLDLHTATPVAIGFAEGNGGGPTSGSTVRTEDGLPDAGRRGIKPRPP